jgi:hypothetical protein
VGDLVVLRYNDPHRRPGETHRIPVWTYNNVDKPCYRYESEDAMCVLTNVTERCGSVQVLLSGERCWVRLSMVNTVQRARR